MALILHVNITEPAPIRSTPVGRFITKITNNIAYRVCRKIGYIGTVCGISYWIARYLNEYRNSARNAAIQHTPGDNDHFGTVTINTDGLTTIQGQDGVHGVTIRTERLDQDVQRHSLLEQGAPVQARPAIVLSRWQRFWRWLLRPAHRAVMHHVISVPRNTNIVLNTQSQILNAHKHAHLHQMPIIIDAVNGRIEAHADSGDIRITNPGGDVIVGTPDRVEIRDFARSIAVNNYSSLHATRGQANRQGTVTLDGEIQPIQAEYQV